MNKKSSLFVWFTFLYSSFLTAQSGIFYGQDLNDINDIVETDLGEIWVATDFEIVHIANNGNQITKYPSNAIVPSPGTIHTIEENSDTIWIGTDNGVYKFDGSIWTILPTQGLTTPVVEIVFTANNTLWCLGGGSFFSKDVFEFTGNAFTNHNIGGFTLKSFQNTLYLGTRSNNEPGHFYANSVWDTLPSMGSAVNNQTIDFAVDITGNLWSAHDAGISHYDGQSWIDDFSLANSITHTKIIAVGQTIYTPLISGFGSGGVLKITTSSLDTIATTYVYNSPISAFTAGKFGNIWIGKEHSIFQFFPELALDHTYEELSLNQIQAGVSPNGGLYKNFNQGFSFVGLKAGGKQSIFASGLWLGGIDQNFDTLLCIETYGQNGVDFYSGPISQVYDSLYVSKYNHVWKVTKSEIQTHQQQFNNPTYSAPFGIADWPGNGDQAKGEARFLAPFEDYNYNGVYEPSLGEHPDIRGDEALYFIMNDTRGSKTESNTNSMQMEIHGMMYAYDSAVAEFENSIFLTYKIHNRSGLNYNQLKLGLWTDYDIGAAFDDVIGSDSVNGVFYAYNGDSYDEGPLGYGSNPPAFGGTFLSDSLSGFMYYNNTSSFGPTATTDPQSSGDYINIMNRRWKDSSPLTVENPSGLFNLNNGDGYEIPASSSSTNFAYNDAANWYESPANSPDTRTLALIDIGGVAIDEERCIDLALIYGRDSAVAPLESFNSVIKLKDHAQNIHQFYNAKNFECLGESLGVTEDMFSGIPQQVYPNPVSRGETITVLNNQTVDSFQMVDVHGKTLLSKDERHQSDFTVTIPSTIRPGLYFLVIHHKGNDGTVLKLSVL